MCNLCFRKAWSHWCWKLEGYIGTGFLNVSCSDLFFFFFSFPLLPWDPLLGTLRCKARLTFLVLYCMGDHFSRCLTSNSFLNRVWKGTSYFGKSLPEIHVCVMSVKLFLCRQRLTHIFISFCLTRLRLCPKSKGFVFSLKGKKQSLTLPRDPWITFVSLALQGDCLFLLQSNGEVFVFMSEEKQEWSSCFCLFPQVIQG